MQFFKQVLHSHPSFSAVQTDIQKGKFPLAIYGVSTVHKSHLISVLAGDSESSCLVLVPEERLANRICSNINTMCGREVAAVYPQKDYVFHDVEGVSREFEYQRLSVLGKLLAGDVKIVIATAPAAWQYTLAPSRNETGSFVLRPGVEVDVSDLASKLVKAGYVRRSQVDGPAQFAVRGGIVDLFAPIWTALCESSFGATRSTRSPNLICFHSAAATARSSFPSHPPGRCWPKI